MPHRALPGLADALVLYPTQRALADADVDSLLELLGLEPGGRLDAAELKSRYFELARRMHPDVQALGRCGPGAWAFSRGPEG